MTEIAKSQWTSDGANIRLQMPLSKVDQQNRLVSGFATLDNVDTQGDVVLSEASAKAFARARGNLREMHAPIAVGKIVDFREDEFYDSATGTFYRGIFVTARVSEGAPDTWAKVLDGTLSGFSIGGSIIEATNEFVKDSGVTVRFIKDYDLIELSLVDNPANQLANVFSIQKTATGSVTVKGMAAETVIENVFHCSVDNEIQSKAAETATCLECGSEMENIGWFEAAGSNRAEKVNSIVTKFRSVDNSEGGGIEMGKVEKGAEQIPATEENVTPAEVSDTGVEADTEAGDAAVDEEETAESATPVEVVDEEEAISKKIDELHEAVKTSLATTREETSEAIANLEKKVDEINAAFAKKASELDDKLSGIGDKLETAKSKLAGFEKSLAELNSSGALRKSADLEEAAEPVQKTTTWNGAFSVDNLL